MYLHAYTILRSFTIRVEIFIVTKRFKGPQANDNLPYSQIFPIFINWWPYYSRNNLTFRSCQTAIIKSCVNTSVKISKNTRRAINAQLGITADGNELEEKQWHWKLRNVWLASIMEILINKTFMNFCRVLLEVLRDMNIWAMLLWTIVKEGMVFLKFE